MADPTNTNMASGFLPSNSFSYHDLFQTIDIGLTGYFSAQTAKTALKAPPATAGIVVGGIVVVALLLFVLLKR